MADDQDSKYRVDRVPSVLAQIRELVAKASRKGKAIELIETLEIVLEQLRTKPLK